MILASRALCGVELNDPIIRTDASHSFGIPGLLIGNPKEKMRAPQRDTPDGGVGKKIPGPSIPGHCGESGGSGVGGRGVR